MAANRILDEFKSFIGFVHSGFKYNLQVFPDTMTAATMLFALLFQSPPFAALSGSIVFLNVIHPYIARFFTSFIGGTIGRSDSCEGRFPGISFTRMMQLSSNKKFGSLDDSGWPSYYSVFLGFLTAYAGSMPLLYRQELNASPKRNVATIVGLVVLSLLVCTGVLFRMLSGCDSFLSTIIGLLVGLMLGVLIILFLSWISDRRLTNILALPLLRDKAEDGKPIYVCEARD
jgi:hypothetical protein